ncbi:MAG: hypothetical protein U1F33_00460 [Alphaproteobacteria bacterium]
METSPEIQLLLFGFSAATCCIFFNDAFGRRLFMGIALACAVGVVFMYLMGIYRVLLMIFLAYLAHDWWRERRVANKVAAPRTPRPKSVESTVRASDRHQ